MTRVTPRSINVREIERARNLIEDCAVHTIRVLNSYAAGIEDYTKAGIDPPDVYYDHGAKLVTINDALTELHTLLSDILKEL